jgi:hypothetical protein
MSICVSVGVPSFIASMMEVHCAVLSGRSDGLPRGTAPVTVALARCVVPYSSGGCCGGGGGAAPPPGPPLPPRGGGGGGAEPLAPPAAPPGGGDIRCMLSSAT